MKKSLDLIKINNKKIDIYNKKIKLYMRNCFIIFKYFYMEYIPLN